ncbi:MAG: saccharopine dehydrogenase NADP-binding domain-containing protein [Dehalococcoidia bacterium]|nr:saccharopine dehydrogenase NADP-binding domain-containing protein [Dehalococcoidia bacterium]
MQKVLVIGAGAQGGPCASILTRNKEVVKIVLGDIDLDLANKVKNKIKSDKVTTVKLDAAKVEDIERAAKGVDVIINLTLTAFCSNIMRAALRSGAHYVDTSFGEPTLLDIRARDNILSQIIEKRPVELDREFKEAGLTGLVGCGGSPGVVNVLARYVCDKLNRVDEIHIKLGSRSLESSAEVVSAWEPTWSPFRALWGYAVEPTVFEGGEYRKYPIYAKCEDYTFPDPVGTIPLVYHQHQEPITLPHFIGKSIKYAGFKYPVDTLAGAFIKMGFASPKAIDVKGVRIVPRDVLLKLVAHPVDTFFAEDESTAKLPLESAGLCILEIKGVRSGEEVTYTVSWPFSLFSNSRERLEIYRRFGATTIGVALPAVVGAKMCVEGEAEKGVIAAECLDPIKFLKMMSGMGAAVKFHEVVSKEVSIA